MQNQGNITLIEYATFYGSIQIFKYLLNNNVGLTESLWMYAVHGQNSEIIDIMYYAIKLFSFLENYNYAFSICVFHINKIDSREKKNKCNNKVNIYLFCFIHSFIVIL